MSIPALTETGFTDFINRNPLGAVYYSGPDCSVCKILKPKLMDVLHRRFPRLALADVDCSQERSLAAGQSVFAIPTLIIYTEGREAMRFSRSFSPAQVAQGLQRPYEILLGS